jgi:hypothetical protein
VSCTGSISMIRMGRFAGLRLKLQVLIGKTTDSLIPVDLLVGMIVQVKIVQKFCLLPQATKFLTRFTLPTPTV